MYKYTPLKHLQPLHHLANTAQSSIPHCGQVCILVLPKLPDVPYSHSSSPRLGNFSEKITYSVYEKPVSLFLRTL